MISFLKKYILPKEVDFIAKLQEQSSATKEMVDKLYSCFIKKNEEACGSITEDTLHLQSIRDTNMQELLNSFITPIDRESIYRVITCLDAIALSVRHFVLETSVYDVSHLDRNYKDILKALQKEMYELSQGFLELKKNSIEVASHAQAVRDAYDEAVESYIKQMEKISNSTDIREVFVQKEMLHQLRDIGKNIYFCANSLEDIVVKMV